jgi:hypothetical protein
LSLNTYDLYQNKLINELTPTARSIPTYSGTIRTASNLADLCAAIVASASSGDTIRITNNIDIGPSNITISKGIKLTASDPSLYITSSLTELGGIIFSGDNVLVTDITIGNTGTGSTPTSVAFTSTTASNNYVYNATMATNEFGVTSTNAQIQIENVSFTWCGVATDSHRYIGLYKTTGETFIKNCTFAGNGNSTPVSRGILVSSNLPEHVYTNGKIIVEGCSTVTNPLQQFLICETSLAGSNTQWYFSSNNATLTGGYFIFYNGVGLAGVTTMVVQSNVETLAAPATGSKGIVALDNGTPGTIAFPTNFFAANNTVSSLVTGFSDLTSDSSRVVAYNLSMFTPSTTIEVKTEGWVSVGNVLGPIGGSNTQILYNNSNTATGNAALTFQQTTGMTTMSAATVNNALTVTGPGTFSNALTLRGAGTIFSASGSTASFSNVNISGATVVTNITALGTGTFSNTLNVTGTGTFSNALTANGLLTASGATVNNALNVTGAGTFSNALTVRGTTFSASGSTASLSNVNVSGAMVVTNITALGTATLSNTLNVSGTGTFSNALNVNGLFTASGGRVTNNLSAGFLNGVTYPQTTRLAATPSNLILQPSNWGSTYIVTGTSTLSVTTTGLAGVAAGYSVMLKNGNNSAQSVGVSISGGATLTLSGSSATTNGQVAILYWTGSSMTGYF